MDVEHDFCTLYEKNKIVRWFDKEIGTEYEVNIDSDNTGSIVFFDMNYIDFKKLMKFIKENGFASC